MSLVDKLSTVFNASAAILVASVVTQGSTHAFAPVKLLKNDLVAIKTFLTGSKGHLEIKDRQLKNLTHTGSLEITNSSIENLTNLGSLKVSANSHISSFAQFGSVKGHDSYFGKGTITGSTKFTNSHIDSVEISADTINLKNTEVQSDVIVNDPRNGGESTVTLDGSIIHGQLICKKHCEVFEFNGSVVEGGIIN